MSPAVLEEIVNLVPPPDDNDSKPLRALVFDSVYDSYRGVIVYVRIVDGVVRPGQTMRLMATGAEFTIVETGYMRAKSLEPTKQLSSGEVGYITASIKTVGDARVGDTVTLAEIRLRSRLQDIAGKSDGFLRNLSGGRSGL